MTHICNDLSTLKSNEMFICHMPAQDTTIYIGSVGNDPVR